MAKVKELKFKRRRLALTNYKKRFKTVKGQIDRVVVRRSNKRIIAQIVKYGEKADKVVITVDSNELKKMGWPSRANRSTAYLTGLLLAKKANYKDECVLDIGVARPVSGSVTLVFGKGCVDGGLKLKGTFNIEESTYNSSNTSKYAKALEGEQMQKQFGDYMKENVKIENLTELFNQIKEKLIEK